MDAEIRDMLHRICERYEADTGRQTTSESMIAGLIREKHGDLRSKGKL